MIENTNQLSSSLLANRTPLPGPGNEASNQEQPATQNRWSAPAGSAPLTAVTPQEAAGNLSTRDLVLMCIVLLLSVGVPLGFILMAFTWGAAIWQVMSVIFAAGAFGGFVNALLSDKGFYLPNRQ